MASMSRMLLIALPEPAVLNRSVRIADPAAIDRPPEVGCCALLAVNQPRH